MNKILDNTIKIICKYQDIDEEKEEIIKYGLEILILKLLFFIATVIVGVFLNNIWGCLIFMLLFTPIRSFAGGYHAQTRTKCFIQSMLTVVLVLGILKVSEVYDIAVIPLTLLTALSIVAIWRLSPVDTENKRLEEDECKIFRKKVRIIMCIEIIIILTAYIYKFYVVSYTAMLAIITSGILVIVEKEKAL